MTGPSFHDPSLDSWDAHRGVWQAVTNALPIPAAKEQRRMVQVRVRARVVWERDGTELVEGTSERWAGRAVLVHWNDHRLRTLGCWLDVADVTKLGPTHPVRAE